MSDSEQIEQKASEVTEKNLRSEIEQLKNLAMNNANTGAVVINGPEAMQFDDPGKYWPMWKQRFNIYLLASGKNKEGDDVKIALLLHYIGENGLDIYNSFNLTENENTIELVLKKFDEYCNPKKNVTMETFKFFNMTQQQGQTFCEFETALRKQIKFCEFACSGECKKFEDRILRDKIILGVFDKVLQTKLLESKESDLDDVIKKCKVAELAAKNKKTLENKAEDKMAIDAVQRGARPKDGKQREKTCFRCGSTWNFEHRQACPAMKEGRKCNKCKQPGHFASMCRSKASGSNERRVNVLDKEEPDAVHAEYFDEGKTDNKNKCRINKIEKISDCKVSYLGGGWFKKINVNGIEVNFKMDTGAEINCLPIKYVKKMNLNNKIVKSNIRLYAYNNEEVKTHGKIVLQCNINKNSIPVEFEIVDNDFQPILGIASCVKLNLIKKVFNVNCDELAGVKRTSAPKTNNKSIEIKLPEDKEVFLQDYIDVFDGLGQIPGKCLIELKDKSEPKLNYKKRIPFSLHDKLKKQLDLMVNDGVISKVNKPTDWVNNLQIVEKPDGSLRICLDPKPLNECIKRERCIIPTSESIISRVGGAKYFTVMDLKNGFWQVVLDERCSELTTFITPFGLYKWNRMPFGLNNAPEVFMRYMIQIFGDLEGVEVYFDDLCIFGKNKQEHDERLLNVIRRARDFNVKFNKKKVQYKATEVCFMGQIISEGEIKPDNKYLRAIREMPSPEDKQGVLRLLGMCKFLAKYIPNLSAITANLRELTHDNVKWQWTDAHQNEIEKLKQILSTDPVLKIYDPKTPLVIQTDASKDGIGCVLLQDGRPVAFASRSLNKTEKRYAQIEKELLAVVVACEKFHYFIYGREVEVHSDHKPLETLIKRDLDKVTARLQRMFMQLLRYPALTLKYVPGKQMLVADCLSRAFLPETEPDDPVSTFFVHSLIKKSCMSNENKVSFVRATEHDRCLKNIVSYIGGQWPTYKNQGVEEKKFYKIKDELSIGEGLLFFRDRLVVPSELRKQTLQLLHSAHLGIEKTRMRSKELYYWPGMSSEIEEFVAACRICEGLHRRNPKEPLQQHPVPKYAWEQVAMDIFEYAGTSYLAVVDSYSGWLISEKLKNKSIDEIIRVLKQLFTKFGIPTGIRSDNVPFNSYKFKNFANECNMNLTFSSPNYPQSNGLAEKAVSIAKNILKKNILDNRNDYQEQILEYNVTPLQDMLLSPAQLFMGRTLKTRHPISKIILNKKNVNENDIIKKIKNKREKQQLYYNKSAKLLSKLYVNDKVLFLKNNKWHYGIIIKKYNNRSYIVKDSNGNTYRRNRRFMVNTKNEEENICYDYIDEYSNEQNTNVNNNNVNYNQSNVDNNNNDDTLLVSENVNISRSDSDVSVYEEADNVSMTETSTEVTSPQVEEPYVTRTGRSVQRPHLYGEWEHY